jgi:mono/diheme cytochrome c family protein
VLAALLARRLRVASAIAAAVVAWFAVPHFSLLLVEANPYSFFKSPTGFGAQSIVEGAWLYPTHCAACHGAEGHGDGKLASTLPVPPADLTAGHLWMHSDGDLFHWLTDGIKAPRGGQAMPGFGKVLSEDERWALIDYVRAHNAGTMMQTMGDWMPPVQAPAFDLQCGAASQKLAGLRGRPVRLILGGPGTIGPQPGMTTILAAPATNIASIPGVCITYDPSVPQAYAIVGGTAPALPPGTQFLIDADGWLRAMQRPGVADSWNNPKALAAAVSAMHARRLAPQSPAPMSMNMPM